ncbi:dTDP-4-dehydrorhamnose 3,5-epimerase family protein [Oryzobacter sp. 24SJ04S-52]|uniref:dTDP-4-dehydrorhamnose 3,5-epimerase family protein n=1 Tax=Oryzobacter telluris TaxID=3149179 RepID=UPI00370D0148
MGLIEEQAIRGVLLLRGARHPDHRGNLRKVLSARLLRQVGVSLEVDEVLTTTNSAAGTVRGLHYQVAPNEETKTLWVTHGAIYDVVVDVRPDEPTYGTWLSVHLSADDDTALHLPPGVAHGYQTLADDTSLTYLMAGAFSPVHARTIRWDDPRLGISWPVPATRVSDKDRAGSSWPPA